MYQPYPSGTQMLEVQRPPVPLVGLTSVTFLWRRASTDFFKGIRTP